MKIFNTLRWGFSLLMKIRMDAHATPLLEGSGASLDVSKAACEG